MSKPEIALFSEALAGSQNYLEYGSGGSTKFAAQFGSARKIVSVESDPGYIAGHVLNDDHVQKAVTEGRLQFQTPNLGPTTKWGFPADTSKIHLWPSYALCPYLQGFSPDLILIDGRFRIACALVAAMEAPEAKVLIHDYTIRRNYSIIERFFSIESSADTLIQAKRLKSFDYRSASRMLKFYLFSPGDEAWNLPRRIYDRTYKKTRAFLKEIKRDLLQRMQQKA